MPGRQGDLTSENAFIRRVLIVLALVGLFLLAWYLRTLLLLVFGAVLVAVIFRAIAAPVARITRVPETFAVVLAVLFVLGLLALVTWVFGSEVAKQVGVLREAVPEAWRSLEDRFGGTPLGDYVQDMIGKATSGEAGMVSSIGSFVMSLGGALTDALVVVVGGIYLATQPRLYRTGALKLLPAHRRTLAAQVFDSSGRALRLWLRGQLVSMLVIGLLTGLGLWLIGVPSALALGLLAGLLEFIPLVGPIIAALPALLIALAMGPETALWVLGLYVVLQQIEGNLLQPAVQQYAVDLPAVILLFSLLGFGVLFGAPGVVLAAPLTVVTFVAIKRLYVREALDTPTPIPGEGGD